MAIHQVADRGLPQSLRLLAMTNKACSLGTSYFRQLRLQGFEVPAGLTVAGHTQAVGNQGAGRFGGAMAQRQRRREVDEAESARKTFCSLGGMA